jgi:DNA-binding transcriptional MerR regulator
MPAEYTLSELAKLGDVTARTVRYYIAQGLLPAPEQLGPKTRYTDSHLDRLRLIRRLQSAHLPLAEIRRQLSSLPSNQVAGLADGRPSYERTEDSALDYIESLLRPAKALAAPAPAAAMAPIAPAAPASISAPSGAPAPSKPAEPERAQWERISLDPDVELHIRRPLTRQQNRRVERLISIARQLLEEE